MSSDAKTTFLDLIKDAYWPLIAAVSIFLFYEPLESLVSSVAKRADHIQTLKLGDLELAIQADQLPKADGAVAKALQGLSTASVQKLIFAPADLSTFGHCYSNQTAQQATYDRKAFDQLMSSGLLKRTSDLSVSSACQDYQSYDITFVGQKARIFLLGLLDAQIAGLSERKPSDN